LLGVLFYRRRYLTMHEESRQSLAKGSTQYEANSNSPSQG